MPSSEQIDRAPEGTRAVIWKVAIVAVIAPFMTQMDATVVNVSLSTISHTLSAPIASAQWIISGYLLAMALMLPLNGWLVDRVGAKHVYMLCFALFTGASVLCGVAQTMGELIGARVFQGLIGGVLAPMTQMMIGRVAGKNMAKVMGYATLPILIAPILGPVVAGVVLAHASWRWLFYLNVPVGLVGIVLATWLLPADSSTLQKRPFDFLGFALISPGLVGVIYGLQYIARADGQVILAGGVILIAGFLWYALHKAEAALIDIRVFKSRTFSVAAVTQFFANGILFGRQLVVPLYLIAGCGLSATHAGSLIAAIGVGMMCSLPSMGFLTQHFGCRAVAAGGALLSSLSTFAFVWMVIHPFSAAGAAIALFLAGVGQGTISIPSISAAYSSIPKPRIPIANTALNIAQRVGAPVATTLLAIVISLTVRSTTRSQPDAFLMPFVALAGLHLLTLASTLCLPPRVEQAPRP